jgi:hypothetical protein
MGVERERERERARAGWGGGSQERARSVLGAHPNLSHGNKILGKTPLTKKADEKSLTFKSKV